MRRLLPMLLVSAAIAFPCRASNPPGQPALTTVAEVLSQGDASPNAGFPISLTGIVTLVDPGRNLLVLQDETGALVLHPDQLENPVRPGQRISLKAAATAPFVGSCSDYPFRPTGHDIQDSFELPTNEGEYRLNRVRGWLRPPVTGDYTFWIASDDSSELWLGAGADPLEAQRVAMVPAGQWTDERDWDRYPPQRSEKVSLCAGRSYYIEVLHEQLRSGSHVSVAWEGPGQKRDVIAGEHLVPWDSASRGLPAATGPAPSRGILREYWSDYSAARVTPLTIASWSSGELAVHGMEFSVLEDEVFPEPRPIDPGLPLEPDDDHRWVEGDAAVGFLASDGTSATLELIADRQRLLVLVARWEGPLPAPGPDLRVRFRGVCEAGRNSNGHLMAGVVWTPSGRELSFYEEPGSAPRAPLEAPLSPEAAMGGAYFARGVVTFNDQVLGKDCLFVQETFGGIYISQQIRRIQPVLQIGQSVEIGGNLIPGKHAPAMRPRTLSVLGRVPLPAPAVPAAGIPATDYRDAQWTEAEGVVRSVNDDGTMTLMGKNFPLRVWVGESYRDDLESLVNSALRVRGVMTLETFDTPLLLIPSRRFVEITRPPPALPLRPVPIASLNEGAQTTTWVHQTRVSGIVTHKNENHFYLQDASGAVRVHPHGKFSPPVGGAIEVVGFPSREGETEGIIEATCLTLADGVPDVPEPLDLRSIGPDCNGALMTIEARLLSLKNRGADHVLELQTDQQVFEAVIEAPQGGLQDIAAGSLLAVTGVGILDAASPTLALKHLLLNSPKDITFLSGPPWWTRQRTAMLIGALLAVVAGTSLRILFLNRRFARQQAARLAFARGVLESQENERRRIAASLHDSLGQDLLVIRNQTHLAIQSAEKEPALRMRLEEISNTTLQAINEVREITHNLRPYQLDRLGLTQAIRAITRKVSEICHVMFACHVDEIDGIFDNESEIHIYRIVQEGINNVLKHSGATEATVVVKAVPGILSISIRDNGRGLAAGGSSADAGFGIGGIRERAEILGGSARFESTSGQGFNLLAQFPIQTTRK